MNRRALLAVAIVLAAGAGLSWWWLRRPPPAVDWQGYAEADFVKVAPTQQGLLTAVSVARGDMVTAGAPLFAQDETSDRAARDQAARQLAQARQLLANLEASGKPTEIEQAAANAADARSMLVRSETDLRRAEALARNGNATWQSVDQLRADTRSAQAKLQAAEAALAQQRGPLGREGEIAAQRAAVDAAVAALAMADWRLAQRHVAAPASGSVADVLARPGETLAAGAPVVSLLPPENIFVRFFVPEPALATLHPGDPVAFACDSCPPDLGGSIAFISPHAEYTPPVIYSESNRTKLVFLVEARPRPDQATRLNPGQPVEVRPVAKPPS